MFLLLFFVSMMFCSTLFADQRIRVPIVVDDLIAKNRDTGMQTFNVTASSGNTNISGSLGVSGPANLKNALNVAGAANLSSTLTVSGSAIIYDDFTVRADNGNRLFKVSKTDGATAITANTTVGGTLGVTGSTTMGSTLTVAGNETVGGAIAVGGTLGVSGASTLTGNTSIGGTLGVTGAAAMSNSLAVVGNETVGGTLGVTGNIAVNTNKFNVTAASGNTNIAGTLTVAGDTTVNGILHANGGMDIDGGQFLIADTSGNTAIAGKLDVTGSTSLDGIVVLQDNLMFGTRTLTDISTSTTRDLLQITLPDINNYVGIVDVSYVGDMADNTGAVSELEFFSTKYLISRMDKTLTATISRISESYYNTAGSMSEPTDTSSIYAKSLGCDYTHAKSWVPNSRTITLRYLSPTQKNRKDINATVLYEIRSGGTAGGPSIGLAGLWAR